MLKVVKISFSLECFIFLLSKKDFRNLTISFPDFYGFSVLLQCNTKNKSDNFRENEKLVLSVKDIFEYILLTHSQNNFHRERNS